MNKKSIASIVMKLYLYADICKMIHYSTRRHHGHVQADEVRECIMSFADSLAEQAFGFTGLPNFSDFSLRVPVRKTNDLSGICANVFSLVDEFRKSVEKNTKYSGIVSLIDDFKGKLSNCVYLNMFDNVSSKKLNESVTKAIRSTVRDIVMNEGRGRNRKPVK